MSYKEQAESPSSPYFFSYQRPSSFLPHAPKPAIVTTTRAVAAVTISARRLGNSGEEERRRDFLRSAHPDTATATATTPRALAAVPPAVVGVAGGAAILVVVPLNTESVRALVGMGIEEAGAAAALRRYGGEDRGEGHGLLLLARDEGAGGEGRESV